MSNYVSPYLFSLRVGSALGKVEYEKISQVRDNYFSANAGLHVLALRWSTDPNLGFPRQPFQVYRRRRYGIENFARTTVLAGYVAGSQAGTSVRVLAGGDLAYVVLAEVQVTSPPGVTVQALDAYGLAIPDQVLNLTQSARIEFRCPGIAALSVIGAGLIGPIVAIGETTYANLPDWEPIQTVGLPLLPQEIGPSYKTLPQGFWPNSVTPPTLDGVTASVIRVFVTDLLQQPPPPTGITDFPLPAWPRPNPLNYVANIRSPGNLVPMIERCLQNSVDNNPAQMQSAYTETVTTGGMNQIGVAPPSPSPQSQVRLPVTGLAMLAAGTDGFASVALGYGTFDLPPGANTSNVAVSVNPNAAAVPVLQSFQFMATVTSASSTAVVWSVNGVTGGNARLGTISTTGLYTAPSAIPSVTIVVAANSVEDPSKFATAVVQVEYLLTHVPLLPAAGAPRAVAAAPRAAAPAAVPFATTTGGFTLPAADAYGNYDYMVSAPYTFPFNVTLTLAALSVGQLPVVAPAGLNATPGTVHAPLQRNQPTPTPVRLSWNASPNAQGYAILASRTPDQSQFLNAQRPASVGGYDAFIGLPPVNPDPNLPPTQQNPAFSDVACTLPLAAPPINNRYLVAGQDVFGLWSGWSATDAQLGPPPVTKPALTRAEFILPGPSASPPSEVVTATLRIDFGWNWQDRAPGQIRFTGQFVPAPATSLNPPYLGGFAMQSGGSPGTAVVLTFSYTGVDPDTVDPHQIVPTITSGHASNGPVVILGEGSPPNSSSNPNLVQYRVELTGIQLDFSAAKELDFLVYATATELVQPGAWSDPIDQPVTLNPTSPPTPPTVIGKIVRVLNPNPPVVVFDPPVISWTALPDATGTARGVLSWQADPSAAGYYIWEATESALLHILPPGSPGGTPDASPGTPAVTRAATLRALLSAYPDASLQGFARLNKDKIQASSAEVTLPGSAQALYVYRISAISANNVESARSASVAIFGVPHRSVPGTPRIMVRTSKGSPQGLQLIVLPVASAAPPAGYRLFRIRNEALAQDASAMGPAKFDETSPLWQDYASTTLAGKPLVGKSLIDTSAVPSWYPYYYRATAIGAGDLPNGVYPGESPYSRVQSGLVLPAGPPLIVSAALAVDAAGTSALITLATDLPAADVSPIGPAKVELLLLTSSGSPGGPLKLEPLLVGAPDQLPLGPPVFPPPGSPPAPGVMTKSASDVYGVWTLSIVIGYTGSESGNLVVRLTDPLGRQSSTTF